MRERLIDVLNGLLKENFSFVPISSVVKIADELLENGVIVPPCKVGDVVYEALPSVGHIRSNKVVGFHLGKFPDTQGHKRKEYLICYSDYSLTHIAIDKFGKTVFLTKEEAEQALKGGAKE